MLGILKLGFVLTIATICESANILYAIPYSVKSHYIMQRPVGLELARRGHNVTVITAHREIDHPPNYHQVMVFNKTIWDVLGRDRPNLFTLAEYSAEDFHREILWKGGLALTEGSLQSPEVQSLLAENRTFDLVISELFFQEATYALAHKYNAPLVLISTMVNCMKHSLLTGNPLELATTSFEFLDTKNPTSFWGRLRNLYLNVYDYFWWRYWFLEKQEELVRKYIPNLPQPVPSLYDLEKNASLLFLNSHFSFQSPVAFLPNIVEIGGIHLKESDSKLPDDLQKILDRATEGVVYVNFGSNVRSSELPIEKKNALINVFKRLNQTVLWKWEAESLDEKPDNVIVRKWMPQKEILSHPNIKVFLSHGGLIGTLEAVFHGVPIIGIPIYGDQYKNLIKAEEAGTGTTLLFHDINEENLERLLHEFLKDDSYLKRAKELSRRFKDRPMSPLDTAMFWIEYVIRNKGAHHIKSPALNMSWITYNMLDVYAFVIIVFCLLSSVIYKTAKLVSQYKCFVRIGFGYRKPKYL
ncbi:hypothetical protein HW555_004472 [Spodoptera exigua]|uniref:UDP-glucuronosyltransferase n=1 Tax=Spodoptera exigua TaxID=7107 RepID=A0A835GLJ7_SPOEX|nr:hypothetical protein HW555_004472 [Spodoptera exigua]